MFVGRKMTRKLVTVTGDTNILKARNLLKEYDIDQLPVVDGKKLIGIITDRDIRENSASPANTLSVHELNYLLSEMKVDQVMTKKVVTVSPGTTIEEAAQLINKTHVNSLPVVTGGELVGIITSCDLLNILLEFMGVDIPSSRIEVTISNNMGEIAKIAKLINDMGLTIVSIISSIDSTGEKRTALIRINTDDTTELCRLLKETGYSVAKDYKIEK